MARSLSTTAQSKRGRGFRPLANALKTPAKKIVGKRGFYDQFLIANWRDIVGSDLAAITRPFEMKSSRTGPSRLVIECASGYTAEITMRCDEICMKINAAIGHEAVSQISLRHNIAGFVEPKPLPKQTPVVPIPVPSDLRQTAGRAASTELRDALQNITQAFYNKG